jgi:hypothetical protein
MIGPVATGSSGDERTDMRSAIELAGAVVGLGGYVSLIGGIIQWVRLSAAHLPADLTSTLFDLRLLFAIGLRVVVISAVALLVISLAAWLASAPRWEQQHDRWRAAIAQDAGTTLGPQTARTVAGLNVLALALVIALGVASLLESFLGNQWVIAGVVGTFLVVAVIASLRSERLAEPRVRTGGAVLVVATSLFCEVPIALLMLAALGIAAAAPAIARLPRPHSVTGFLRSPLPWALGGVYAFVALGFVATPPVTYPRALVQTDAGVQVGGYIAHNGDGVYLATCLPGANDRSTTERVSLIREDAVKGLTLGGQPYRLDSGDRPALLSVLARPLGLHLKPPVVARVELRAAQPVCDAAELASGGTDTGLGNGVVVNPHPFRPPPRDAEPPILRTSAAALAKLARRYQPTVETTVADRFWPTSVTSVLQETGHHDDPVCLTSAGRCVKPAPTLADLTPAGAATDALDLPAPLVGDPTPQFLAFTRGQGISDDVARNWLADPTALNPWRTATVYFYYAGKVSPVGRFARLPSGLLALQYWFYYPYNYYPTLPRRQLMPSLPLAADPAKLNTDLHEGDWEHVTVLVDEATLHPQYLYLARHDQEGVTMSWRDPALTFDGLHPIVQAAFGGHPSYDNHCRERPRQLLRNQSADWVVCGSGRYVFRGGLTPLVDLARASWACWPGHFGQADAQQLRDGTRPERDPLRWRTKLVRVPGPVSPLRQTENAGVCERGPRAAELAAPVPARSGAGAP